MWHRIGKDPGIQRVGSVPLNIPSKEVEEEAETKEETECVLGEYFIATHANLICPAFFTDQRRTHGVRVDACLGPPLQNLAYNSTSVYAQSEGLSLSEECGC